MQTSVWILRHPDTGRTVTLVGTMHIGESRYFSRLSELLDGLARSGAEIHVEGIAHRDGETLTELERRRLAVAQEWRNPERSASAVALLEADSQGGNLHLPNRTRNIDLSHAELLRRIGWREYRRLFGPPPGGDCPLPDPVLRSAIRFQLRHHRALETLRAFSPRQRRVNRVVIGERNAVAFAGASETLRERDVVLVWGCDHLPGLARLFTAAGYRLRRWRWLDACAI